MDLGPLLDTLHERHLAESWPKVGVSTVPRLACVCPVIRSVSSLPVCCCAGRDLELVKAIVAGLSAVQILAKGTLLTNCKVQPGCMPMFEVLQHSSSELSRPKWSIGGIKGTKARVWCVVLVAKAWTSCVWY